jgi:hypothetical protein
MGVAFKKTLEKTSCAILVGTDCASFTEKDLKEAARALKRGAKAVLGPVEDGGYFLIGMQDYSSELFTGIPWGTESVMEGTRKRLQQLRWRWHELRTFWDVDRPEDVERLVREGLLSRER